MKIDDKRAVGGLQKINRSKNGAVFQPNFKMKCYYVLTSFRLAGYSETQPLTLSIGGPVKKHGPYFHPFSLF